MGGEKKPGSIETSGVRYGIFFYHDYSTQYITIRYISQYTNSSLNLCVYTDTCSTDVLEVQYRMVHDNIASSFIVYNDILGIFFSNYS